MELTILDRMLLLNALPEKGNLITLRVVRTLRESLTFSEEEIAYHEIQRSESGQVTWEHGDATKTIQLGAKAHATAVEALETLDKTDALTEQHLGLCDKFGLGLD